MTEYYRLSCGCVVSAQKKRKLYHYEIIIRGCGSSSSKFTDIASPTKRGGTPLTKLGVDRMRKEFKIWLTIYFLMNERPCANCEEYYHCNLNIKSRNCKELLFDMFLRERRK